MVRIELEQFCKKQSCRELNFDGAISKQYEIHLINEKNPNCFYVGPLLDEKIFKVIFIKLHL